MDQVAAAVFFLACSVIFQHFTAHCILIVIAPLRHLFYLGLLQNLQTKFDLYHLNRPNRRRIHLVFAIAALLIFFLGSILSFLSLARFATPDHYLLIAGFNVALVFIWMGYISHNYHPTPPPPRSR